MPSSRSRAHARPLALFTLAWLASIPAWAQPAAAPLVREPIGTLEQKTERITHEDAGSRIEELRIGGQTRSIEVQTKSGVPAYQVTPIDPSRPTEGTGQGASPEGKSSWRILKF